MFKILVGVDGLEPTIPLKVTVLQTVAIAAMRYSQFYPTLRFQMSRYIGFLSFNKPAGLTLLKLVKLLGASVT